MSEKHPFFMAVSGELPAPPAAKLLDWKPLEAVRGSGRFRVQFDGSQQLEGEMVATATSTARIVRMPQSSGTP